mgnify:CR=1 FL=1
MLWLILSLMTALSVASQDAWVKKFFSHLSPYEMLAYPLAYSTPIFIIMLPFVPVPRLDAVFFWCSLVGIPLNGIAFLIHIKAIRIAPLSLTIPYLAFTPAFIIITGYLFLDEMPNAWGIFGILIICAGCYILNIDPGKWRPLDPFKAVFKETGSWLMLIAAFLYSFGAVIGKKAILHSSPLFFTVSYFGAFNLTCLLFFWILKKIRLETFREPHINGIIAGGLLILHVLFHCWAVSLTKAAYMISVKRLSILFSVIYGKFIFKEENMVCRLSGALLMLLGTVIISLHGL